MALTAPLEAACTVHHSRLLPDELPRLTRTDFSVKTTRQLLSAWLATDKQPDVIDVLSQQLAEQHIPLSMPFTPPVSKCQPGSTGRKTAVNAPTARQALLDRFLADAASPCKAKLDSTEKLDRQVPHGSFVNMHTAAELDKSSHPFPLSGTALETLSLSSSQLQAIQAYLHPDSCWHCDRASSVPSKCNRSCSAICQSAEILVLKSSKGQTWEGLALRQTFMGRDAAQRDGEAFVQDAAGGGGLLHGGAEDGGEGGGPSRDEVVLICPVCLRNGPSSASACLYACDTMQHRKLGDHSCILLDGFVDTKNKQTRH
ncbi:MAG: hypothetical protein FRX49_01489 [Trebouxia sp. A1-2]|nr:MAG: hypothetical protein FRX49_01489 [Trebouxia sp. A1-2]